MIRHERRLALSPTLLVTATLAVVLALPAPAVAAPASRAAVLPAELANSGDVLPVSRRKDFVIPRRSTDRALVFAPYAVNDYREGMTGSWSNTTRWGKTKERTAEGERSFSFALHGGSAQLPAECDERAAVESRRDRGEPPPREVPDHALRCTLYAARGTFELTVLNGRGELVGTGGERFEVSVILSATSRWEPSETTGLLLSHAGDPVAAVDFVGKGRVVLQRALEPARREVLAAAAAALLLADLDRW